MTSGSIYATKRNLVLAASAGTGKTHALVGVILHRIVVDRIDPTRIVATTFSRKAAAEIRVRVAGELDRLAASPASSAYVGALRDSLRDPEIASRARRAMARLPHARIGTLHGFATSLVRSYAVELGLGPGFDLAAEADARALAEDAISAALAARLTESSGELRALSDAAGGIERLVTQLRALLVQLDEDGRAPGDLAVEPELGDAALLERALATLIDHARALVEEPRFSDPARELVAASRAGDDELVESAAAALCSVRVAGKKSPQVEAFAAFRAALDGANNEERGRRLVRTYRARAAFARHATLVRDVLVDAAAEIARSGVTTASLGFGEVLRAARDLLRARPDVAEEVANGVDALLVDEFQDTSRVQREIIQLLWAEPSARAPGLIPPLDRQRRDGLVVVGDRKQSIYGFRGADVSVFAELAVGLAGTPAREALGIPPGLTWEPRSPIAEFHALRHNRRSVPAILAFANEFAARRFRPGDPPPELFEIDYVPETEDLLVPPERRGAGEPASGEAAVVWLRIRPKRGNASTRLEEALTIAARIRELLAGDGTRVGHDRRRPTLRDVAVLATTNGMLDAAAFALAQADIPYVVAGRSFFRTREVRDLAALLGLVLDPTDRLAMLEVLRGPFAAVHDETLLGLTRPGEGLVAVSSFHAPPSPELVREEDRPALAALAELVASLSRSAGRLGPGTILREAVRARSLREVLAAMPRGAQRVANVEKLLAIADRHNDVRAFAAWLRDAMAQETSESEAATFSDDDDAVRLLTIHASKGLDFPIVFVPEIAAPQARSEKGGVRVVLGSGEEPSVLSVRIADGRGLLLEPPSFVEAWTLSRRRDRAERQRLAYVAVTRAADAMFFVGGRTSESVLDPGSSTLAVLEGLVGSPLLAVEDVEVPSPEARDAGLSAPVETARSESTERRTPAWRSLPIAPTALLDFAYCARRFELVHLLGLPEHRRGRDPTSKPKKATAGLDARAQGTVAHAVLERVPLAAFGGGGAEAIERALAAEGVPEDHPQHAAIATRVGRFLGGAYARAIAERGADVRREVAFVLGIEDREGRTVTLRGQMDLVVVWPDGSVDVVDYKSARSKDLDAYGFQLDVYALAAREAVPDATSLRAGLVFLGGGDGEPVWRDLPPEQDVRAQISALGARLVEARWTARFPRTTLDRCEAITCGFIGRCHATSTERGGEGTEQKPSRATTT